MNNNKITRPKSVSEILSYIKSPFYNVIISNQWLPLSAGTVFILIKKISVIKADITIQFGSYLMLCNVEKYVYLKLHIKHTFQQFHTKKLCIVFKSQ